MAAAHRYVPVIDAGAHVWPVGLRHPTQATPAPLASAPPDLLRVAAQSGVDRVVVSPASAYRDNEYILRVAEESGGRIIPVVDVNPRQPPSSALLTHYGERGAAGIRINLSALRSHAELTSELDDLVDAAAELRLRVVWSARPSSIAAIERAAGRAAGIWHVLDHLGLPENPDDQASLQQVSESASIPRLSVKLSGLYAISRELYPYRDTWAWVAATIMAFGPARTMWASDWPLATEVTSYAQQRALVDEFSFLDSTSRADILRGAGYRIWVA